MLEIIKEIGTLSPDAIQTVNYLTLGASIGIIVIGWIITHIVDKIVLLHQRPVTNEIQSNMDTPQKV